MKILGIIFTAFIFVGIMNWMEIQKIRTKKREKEATLKLLDTYLKLYWKALPKFVDGLRKEKGIPKKTLERLLSETNRVYEKMDISESLIRHAKIVSLLEPLKEELKKPKLKKQYQELEMIEKQIMVIGKEYERLNKEYQEMRENPFVKFLLPFFKL